MRVGGREGERGRKGGREGRRKGKEGRERVIEVCKVHRCLAGLVAYPGSVVEHITILRPCQLTREVFIL